MADEPSASPLKFLPSKRQRLCTDWNKCVICQDCKKEKLTEPKPTGIEAVIQASIARQDNVLKRLKTELGDLQKLHDNPVRYHRSCYQSFTSKKNIAHVHITDNPCEPLEKCDADEGIKTRTKTVKLTDWSMCLICSSHRRDTLHAIQTMTAQETLYQAAQARNDHSILARIEGEDLIAADAVYHKSCMASYVSKRNIDAALREEKKEDIFHKTFMALVKEIDEDLQQGKAFKLKSLLAKFHGLLPEHIEAQNYRAQKLQQRLLKHYGDKIVIHTLRGQSKSNIVISSSVSLGDAIRAFAQLKEDVSLSEMMLESDIGEPQDCSSILHSAIGILRQAISEIEVPTEYYNASEISIKSSEKLVPNILKKALLWLLSTEAFESGDPNYIPPENLHRIVLALAECIIYNSNNKILTPLHLGLAAQLHHDHGKRDIIDILHAHGYCMSYDDLRRFLTTLGKAELTKMSETVYVPHGLVSRENGGKLIQEGDDNVDINCCTIDGKGTFHAMARVIFQEQPVVEQQTDNLQRLSVGHEKSLPLHCNDAMALKTVLHYEKPKTRPEPPRHNDAKTKIKSLLLDETNMKSKDLAWLFLRIFPRGTLSLPINFVCNSNQPVPFWTGYNAALTEMKESHTVAKYAPVIDAKPADPSTVYTTMTRSQKMTNALGQQSTVQTMDQQLYAVAQQVKWGKPEEFQSHVLRLGGFHSASCFIAAIGKLWGTGGLKDLLVESGVYASNTADMMLAGKQFHRSVRGLVLSYEALMQLFLQEFVRWCNSEQCRKIPDDVWHQIQDTHAAILKGTEQQAVNATRELQHQLIQNVLPLLEQFREDGCKDSPTFQYWLMYLDAIQVLLNFIRSEREGNWNAHLSSQCAMTPYFFSTDRTNYARWVPTYLLDMMELPDDVAEAFQNGEFAIRLSQGRFNGVWSDMGTETTIIRDAKSEGGIVGLTRKESALLRWMLTRSSLGQYAQSTKIRSGINAPTQSIHEQAKPSALAQDNIHAESMICHLETNMIHPFQPDAHPDEKLLNISSGIIADPDVQKSLLSAVDLGVKKMDEFIDSTLSTDGSRSFYSPLSRSKLKTFADMNKKTKVKIQGKKQQLNVSAEMVFRRALKLSQARSDLTMLHLLSQPITAIPTSLFHEDGAMRKTNKAELTHILESKVPKDAASLPTGTDAAATNVYIRDAMAELQTMSGQGQTFGGLAEIYMMRLLNCTSKANTVVDVFDQYDWEDSIKMEERERRLAAAGAAKQYQVLAARSLPPWQKFMAVSSNKAALTNFLCSYTAKQAPSTTTLAAHPEKKIFLAGGFTEGEYTACLTAQGVTPRDDLFCFQEEADSRMIFHAMKADEEFAASNVRGNIIIKSPDTDVLVLAVHYFPQMKSTEALWIETGRVTVNVDLHRFIPVHAICSALSPQICHLLPSLHALTGCDSISSFCGYGKKKVWKTLESLDSKHALPTLGQLGTGNATEAVHAARQFIAALYDPKDLNKECHSDLNALRAKLSDKAVPLHKLPPSEPSFLQHVKRASFQTRIWMLAHVSNQNMPSPEGNGWHREDGNLTISLFDGPSAAELLDELLCTCRGRQKCNKDCSCASNEMTCTEECPCKATGDCRNEYTHSEQEVDDHEQYEP